MKTLKWTDPSSADAALQQAQNEEVIVVRDGHPVALVTPMDDEELSWYLRERDPAFIESIARARADVAAGKSTSHDNLKREFGL